MAGFQIWCTKEVAKSDKKHQANDPVRTWAFHFSEKRNRKRRRRWVVLRREESEHNY